MSCSGPSATASVCCCDAASSVGISFIGIWIWSRREKIRSFRLVRSGVFTPVAGLKMLQWKVSDSPNFFSEFFFPNFVLLCSFLWAVEWNLWIPPLQIFQTAKGKAPTEAWGGHWSGGGIYVTFLRPHESQLSAMRCVALNHIDLSYMICVRSFVVLCPHYSTLFSPLPFCYAHCFCHGPCAVIPMWFSELNGRAACLPPRHSFWYACDSTPSAAHYVACRASLVFLP